MNYRQWKKNYKKQHGYNQPAIEDKRKWKRQQADEIAVIAKALSNFDAGTFVAELLDAFGKAFAEIGRGLDNMGKQAQAAADNMRNMNGLTEENQTEERIAQAGYEKEGELEA